RSARPGEYHTGIPCARLPCPFNASFDLLSPIVPWSGLVARASSRYFEGATLFLGDATVATPNRRGALLTLPLDPASATPLFRQVYDGLRRAILDGTLAAGARIPSTRGLAAEVGVSRNTVMNAYEQLLAEGYLEGQVGSRTYVPRTLPEELIVV